MFDKNNSNVERLATEPIRPLFIKLALPAVLGQIATLLNNVIDRIWIGHVNTSDASLGLTAVGVSMPITMLVISFIFLIVMGMGPSTSIALGRSDTEGAAKISGASFSLAIIFSIISTILILTFCDPLLMMVGCSSKSITLSHDYLFMSGEGFLLTNMVVFSNVWFCCMGDVKGGITVSLISVIANTLLDPVFIFLLGMGVKGAALSTNIGAFLAVTYAAWYYFHNKGLLRIGVGDLKLRWSILLPVLGLGLSSWVSVSLESLSMFVLNGSLQKYGGDIAVASMALFGIPVMMYTHLVSGLSTGVQPIVSYNFGQNNTKRWKKAGRYFITTAVTLSATLWIVLQFFPSLVWGCFTDNQNLVSYAIRHGHIYFAVFFLNGAQNSYNYMLKFLGQIKASFFVGILRKLLLLLPLLIILPAVLPLPKSESIFIAIPLTDLLSFSITTFCYIYTIKKFTN